MLTLLKLSVLKQDCFYSEQRDGSVAVVMSRANSLSNDLIVLEKTPSSKLKVGLYTIRRVVLFPFCKKSVIIEHVWIVAASIYFNQSKKHNYGNMCTYATCPILARHVNQVGTICRPTLDRVSVAMFFKLVSYRSTPD